MTRKDTIMIAVLVNAALLAVLFISAIKHDDTAYHVASAGHIEDIRPISVPEPAKPEIKKTEGDEIDQVLKEFSEKKLVKEEKTQQKIDFAKELEAITKAAAQPAKIEAAPARTTHRGLQVTVKKGDVLDKIARAHNCTVNEIVKANNLSSTVLQIGQVLNIPKKGESPAKTSSGGEKYYTVKQGDNPWTIAVKNQIKVDELLRLNNLNEEKARRLRPGDKLRIQ